MNKNTSGFLLALVVALVLSSTGGAFAQSDMGNTATAGATYMVGVVQSIAPDSVTLVQASGEQMTLMLADHTIGKKFLVSGNRARIDYSVNASGQAVADVIQSAGHADTVVAVPAVTETSEEQVPVEKVEPTPVRVEPAPRTEPLPPAAPAAAVTTTPVTRPYSLPATASGMPGLALLGLLSLAGAVTLRMVR